MFLEIHGENFLSEKNRLLNQAKILFRQDNFYLYKAPDRKNFFDSGEGGQYVDLALFGQILETMNLGQILYILNEDNYKKSYLDFQFGYFYFESLNL